MSLRRSRTLHDKRQWGAVPRIKKGNSHAIKDIFDCSFGPEIVSTSNETDIGLDFEYTHSDGLSVQCFLILSRWEVETKSS